MKKCLLVTVIYYLQMLEVYTLQIPYDVRSDARFVFDTICKNPEPPAVKFGQTCNAVIDLSTHEGRQHLKKIRENLSSRPIDFKVKSCDESREFCVVAGYARDESFQLKHPLKKFPYLWNGKSKPLNYVFDPKDGQKNDQDIPSGGLSYDSLLRGIVSNKDKKLFGKQVSDFLLMKAVNINNKTDQLISLLMSSEYMRGRQALAVASIEHTVLKWRPEKFSEYKSRVVYAEWGGAERIMLFSSVQLMQKFEKMWEESPYCALIKSLSNDSQITLRNDFFIRHLNKLKTIYSDFIDVDFSLVVPIPGKFRDVVRIMIELEKRSYQSKQQ